MVCAMTDLPGVVEFTRLNAKRNTRANGGEVPEYVALAATSLRWGVIRDIEALPEILRTPTLVIGADLMYTANEDVIRALVATTSALARRPGSVAVFAACKEHRPEAIVLFAKLLEEEGFDVQRVRASSAHPDVPASDDEFEILECFRM
jgi:hypothetical protein